MKKSFLIKGLYGVCCILFIFLVFPSNVSAATKVPADAKCINNHYYYVCNKDTYISWEDAKVECEKMGGHLACITSEKENTAVWEYVSITMNSPCWFGLYFDRETSEWKWVNGNKVTYTNWGYGEATDSEDYGGYWSSSRGGTWDDITGTDSRICTYLCEWDITITPSETTIEMNVGDSYCIDTLIKKDGKEVDNPKISYTSSKKSIATVSSEGEIEALSAGTCKITIKYCGATKAITVIVHPEKVVGLKKQTVSSQSMKLAWEKQSGVSGYEVWKYDTTTKKYAKIKSVKSGFSTANITGLSSDTSYKFKVRSFVKVGKKTYYGDYSKVLAVKTK